MLSGCQPGITKAAGILKRKVNTTNRQRTDRHTQKTKNNKQNKQKNRNKLYTYLGKWIMVNNSKCECLLLSKLLLKDSLLGCVFPRLLLGDPRRTRSPQWAGFAWALPSRDHVSPPGAAARPQRSQTSQYRPVAATGHHGLGVVPPCGKERLCI